MNHNPPPVAVADWIARFALRVRREPDMTSSVEILQAAEILVRRLDVAVPIALSAGEFVVVALVVGSDDVSAAFREEFARLAAEVAVTLDAIDDFEEAEGFGAPVGRSARARARRRGWPREVSENAVVQYLRACVELLDTMPGRAQDARLARHASTRVEQSLLYVALAEPLAALCDLVEAAAASGALGERAAALTSTATRARTQLASLDRFDAAHGIPSS